MSEICETCGLPQAEPGSAAWQRGHCYRGVAGFDPARCAVWCYRLAREREKARADEESQRADRYQAEFAACKALLIAAQQRGEKAEAERAEWKDRAEQWALREAALVEAGIRREAEWLNEHQELTRRASEARALLKEARETMRGQEHGSLSLETEIDELLGAQDGA